MRQRNFFGLRGVAPQRADVLLLPLPFEGTVTYGHGTARAPEAIWRASAEVELWDEETRVDLESLSYHSAPPVAPQSGQSAREYLHRVERQARALHAYGGLVVGIGGEHSVTPPLVHAALAGSDDLSAVTVVQIDAHADLRHAYEQRSCSHACAMRRLVERGARVVAIGVRSMDREEARYADRTGRVEIFAAQQLDQELDAEQSLLERLAGTVGDTYLTVDVDGLEVSLCPGTGTPQPGGLGWWQTMRYVKALLHAPAARVIGCDVVETVPQADSRVNEFVAARLVAKLVVYHFSRPARPAGPAPRHSNRS